MITPLLLCGGSGTRLWPLSRRSFPKQFARIVGGESLFAASARRLSGAGEGVAFGRPVVVTGSDFRFIVTEQLLEAGIEPGAILIEPEARNTAPAVLAAALHVAASDPGGLILVAPSDHAIADPAAFRAAVARGVAAAEAGRIVTFGIAPTHAETGYGWLELAEGEAPGDPARKQAGADEDRISAGLAGKDADGDGVQGALSERDADKGGIEGLGDPGAGIGEGRAPGADGDKAPGVLAGRDGDKTPDAAGGDPDAGPVALMRFVEKPEAGRAQAMLEAGNFLWNAGIFLFRADAMIAAFRRHAPGLLAPVGAALDGAQADLGFLRLDPGPWAAAEAISIDYAVMERADNLSVVAYGAGWNDLGGWDAVAREMGADAAGVATAGAVTAIDCADTLLRADSEGVELVGIGLRGIIAVAMDDAVLIADRARAQDVKLAVSALKAKGAKQAEAFARDHRPWGHYETLALSDRFQVKRIVVKPGAALSLQSHVHRSEHWIVVSGTAKVTVDGEVRLLTENQSVYIPLGAVHRMENPGRVPMVLIEVQTGAYLGEDDIIRYEDVYARGQGAKG